jgi:acetyl-CoA acetyltransferase
VVGSTKDDGGQSVCDNLREVKRIVPDVELSDVDRVFHSVYPHVDICEFLEGIHQIFPSFRMFDVIAEVTRTWPPASAATVVESLCKFSELTLTQIADMIRYECKSNC